jgi:ubiquinone/menaquinone biosynthesis C-methylase UbiE
LIEQAAIRDGHRVLDLGCGTATLTLLIRQARPQARVFGVDGDARVLQIAKRKAAQAGVTPALHRALAYQLPYADGVFDRVLSSLLFHHLTREEKQSTLREVRRVLRPGGELHVADWGKAADWRMRAAFFLVQLLDGFERTTDNVRGVLPEFLSHAGFEGVCESHRWRTMFGTLSLYQAQKPAASP